MPLPVPEFPVFASGVVSEAQRDECESCRIMDIKDTAKGSSCLILGELVSVLSLAQMSHQCLGT